MIPDSRVNRFHVGQVWQTSKGHLWKVTSIENRQAVMRQGSNGMGRIKRKVWDDILNMVLFYDPEYPE